MNRKRAILIAVTIAVIGFFLNHAGFLKPILEFPSYEGLGYGAIAFAKVTLLTTEAMPAKPEHHQDFAGIMVSLGVLIGVLSWATILLFVPLFSLWKRPRRTILITGILYTIVFYRLLFVFDLTTSDLIDNLPYSWLGFHDALFFTKSGKYPTGDNLPTLMFALGSLFGIVTASASLLLSLCGFAYLWDRLK